MTKSTVMPDMAETVPSTSADVQDPKIMVLAIHRDLSGKVVITPIDVVHETDDLTLMTDGETKARKILDGEFLAKQGPMTAALAALYEIFNHRLYRNQFRTFENFCFALYGTNRINDELMKKVAKKTAELAADVREEI